jgi:LysR family transcriptional regulator for bpeEF and oprC
MDKLRGMEYLVRVVKAGSFAAASRELEVSPSAVTQMIAALERELGATLLVRGSRGVALTPDGERYHRICGQALAELRSAESDLRGARNRLSGLLVVGMAARIARNCIVPELPRFLACHPELSIDIRTVHTSDEPAAAVVDVLLISTWQHYEDLIERNLAQLRHLTCAAPSYWRRHGRPRHPEALREHVTLAWRTSQGVVMGQWRYRRGDEMHTVDVKPRVVSDDRDSTIELAVRGAGVVRVGDLVAWTHLRNGTLEPALTDWEGLDAPPVRLLYRRNTAASARVRAFAAFVDDVFRRLKAERRAAGYDEPQPEPTPEWFLRLNRHPPAKAPARPKA